MATRKSARRSTVGGAKRRSASSKPLSRTHARSTRKTASSRSRRAAGPIQASVSSLAKRSLARLVPMKKSSSKSSRSRRAA